MRGVAMVVGQSGDQPPRFSAAAAVGQRDGNPALDHPDRQPDAACPGKDKASVERRLRKGGLHCPDCACHLCPWGWVEPQTVWGIGWWRIRLRRSRCRTCGRTHLLSPVNLLWHRRDDVSVIGEALTRSALGGP